MSWKVTTQPAAEPVTTDYVKTHIRQDLTAEDTLLDNYIKQARQFVENRIGLALIDQTIELKLDDFPSKDRIELPRSNLISVTSIAYLDSDAASQTLATSVYGVDTHSTPGAVYLKDGQEWPTALAQQRQVVTITYKAGWADADSVPDTLKHAIALLVAHWDANREPVAPVPHSELDFTITALTEQHRVFGL